jgi:hypothetical protein
MPVELGRVQRYAETVSLPGSQEISGQLASETSEPGYNIAGKLFRRISVTADVRFLFVQKLAVRAAIERDIVPP